MKALAASELLIVACLLLVGWLLKVQAEQLALLEAELDGLRSRPDDPWAERLPS